MPVIPDGLPAWLRANDFQAYGGDLNKKNFASRGVINPKTDVGVEAFSRIVADLAALTRTAPFCVMTVLCNDTGSIVPYVEYVTMMTGSQAGLYLGTAPPSGFPAVQRNGVGDITITFDAAYHDEFGVSGDLVLTQPMAQMHGSVAAVATAELLSATEVRVRLFDVAGASLADGRVTVVLGSGA